MPQLQACHTRMSSDDEEIFKWNMLDDRQFALRPGYKFSNAMTYRQMCQHINMMVQKVGSDAVRPKVRKYATIGGLKVPARVEFYCCHSRKHRKRTKPLKTPEAHRASRTQEGRSVLFSECTCRFTVVVDNPVSNFEEDSDTDNEEMAAALGVASSDANTEKNADLSQNTTETLHIWMVPADSLPSS